MSASKLKRPAVLPVTRRTVCVLLVASLSLGALAFGLAPSGAWYSGAWSSAGFILTSGSFDLQVTGGPLRATNLRPGAGYAPLGEFCASNTGTVDLKYRGLFETTAPLTSDLLQYTTLKVEQQTAGAWSTVQEIPGTSPVAAESLLFYFRHPAQGAEVVNGYVAAGQLAPQATTCYRLSVLLDPLTPDAVQGTAIGFVLHLTATQAANPSWP
jgi:hypothetical protein